MRRCEADTRAIDLPVCEKERRVKQTVNRSNRTFVPSPAAIERRGCSPPPEPVYHHAHRHPR